MIESADTVARSRLRSGEHLLWSGRPDTGRLFNRSDIFLVPFGLFYLGFSIFWTVTAARSGGFFSLFGLLFVTVGVYFVFLRFLVKRYRQLHSTYAVTDRRAFAVVGRKLIETPIASDRTTTWTGDSHVSIMWTASVGIGGFSRGQVPLNSGLDGILSPLPMAFFDVPEPAALMAALDRAATHTTT
ncbi:hypothetical protein [Leifsonia sp. EB34]|uniref:hypothetical protein n=1 Tax=Leifsonia sp. EB34 TaxID=3156303 RepID=UPI003519CAED